MLRFELVEAQQTPSNAKSNADITTIVSSELFREPNAQ
ncbi:hypothetical protein K788_0000413 [Paraburkholderia caribensis MBA4]|uniref:Uncharacterized protein n=1 Tax=Paraburkholderia caribensis MBA4 TaxID=1323664 RepID=A0A0P0RIU3_9BURK|nr:hypothetical protein K788_0000413 [Paraburkholderia caribensis MBA4]